MSTLLDQQLSGAPHEASTRLPAVGNQRPIAWIVFGVYAAGFVTWTLVAQLSGDATSSLVSAMFGSLAFLPLNAGAIYWLSRAAGSETLTPGERSALRLIAVMYSCTAVGNTLWALDEAVRQVDPRYSWADAFYLTSYGLGIAGLSRFPIAPRGAVERRKYVLDAACVVIALGALIWTFVVSPIDIGTTTNLRIGIELLYPVLSIILLAMLCRLLMRQGPHALRPEILLLALSLFTQCVMDLLMELNFRDTFVRLLTWESLICATTYVVIIYSAQQLTYRTQADPRPPIFPVLHPMHLFPTIAAISVYVVLIWVAQSGARTSLSVLVAAAIALNVLFLVKQTLAAEENAVLQAARADAESRARYEDVAREGQRLESVGRLAGGIAHDFNNLLTTVLANSDFALSRMRSGDEGHAEVTDIRSAAIRGAELIRQLLAFSRKSVIAPVRLQPALVLRDMERLLQRLAGERHVLTLDLSPELGVVLADRGQLEQVVANLVTNARDAMPNGGPINISGWNVVLGERAATELALPVGDYVALAVQDSGAGISPDVRAHIFEPFFSTKERGKGTGLGLASSYGIMRQSNGGIAVESEVGRGSRFTLYLPRVASVATPAPASVITPAIARVSHAAARAGTVLLVEDESAVRQVTRRMLVSEGYTVLTAANADAARALFDQHGDAISLMITDVVMPGDSGLTLAAALRARWPDVSVIFISGYPDAELPDGVNARLQDDFLQKPFTGAQLLARVESRLLARRSTIPTGARTP